MSFCKKYISAVFLLVSFTLTTAFAPRSLFSPPTTQYTSCEPSSKTRLFLTTIQAEEEKYLEWAMQGEGVMAKPDVVYVIMYNPGTEQEGVHTMEYPRGSESDLLLAFEFIGDCVNFANVLKSVPSWTQEPVPTPTPLAQMEQACGQMGLPIKVVPCTIQE